MTWDGTVVTESAGRRIQCQALDLSNGGARLRSTWHPYPGKSVAVRFQIDGRLVQMQGVVVWATEAGGVKECGVMFTVGHPSCRERVHQFVARRLAEEDPLAPLWGVEMQGDSQGPPLHAAEVITNWDGAPRVGEPVGWPIESSLDRWPPPDTGPVGWPPDSGPVAMPMSAYGQPSPGPRVVMPDEGLYPAKMDTEISAPLAGLPFGGMAEHDTFEPPPLDEPLEVLDDALVPAPSMYSSADPPTLPPAEYELEASVVRTAPIDDGPTRLRATPLEADPLEDDHLTRRRRMPTMVDDGPDTAVWTLDEPPPETATRIAMDPPGPRPGDPDGTRTRVVSDEATTRKHPKCERPEGAGRRRRGWLDRLTRA